MTKLGLGTVQWGQSYGLANRSGVASHESVAEILASALACGVQCLDTAALYGEAESILGMNSLENFQVVTKTPKFGTSVVSDVDGDTLRRTFERSLKLLNQEKVYGLLIHHPDDIFASGGEKLVAVLSKLKEEGLVEKIGISIYDSTQADAVLKMFTPDIVQLPLNVLDQRMLVDGQLQKLKSKRVEIHVRSVFLQGLLLMPLGQVPSYFDPIRPLLIRWHAAVKEQGLTNIQALFSFVKGISQIDRVLVGVQSLAEFDACFQNYSIETRFDATGLSCDKAEFVNPALWKLT
jgi:aryl-alcohol dehydrogenase-like predicted oxidoreductase